MLVHKYELFKMEPTESIIVMYTRFTNIVSNLKNLGKVLIWHNFMEMHNDVFSNLIQIEIKLNKHM